jgi:hypothetical protein
MPRPFRNDGRLRGDEIPVQWRRFPQHFAAMIEAQRASILNALTGIERCDRATEDVSGDAQPPVPGDELEMDA